jgi:hypothetical protein
MKTVNVTDASRLAELLDLAEEESVLLKTPEGREFILSEVDDFDAEVQAVRQNRDLMEFLDQRSRSEKTYTIEEMRKKLDLD